jgi:hypothetical protein
MRVQLDGQVPAPPSHRGSWVLATATAVLGVLTLAAVLSGLVGSTTVRPPAVPLRAIVPAPAASSVDPVTGRRVYATDANVGRPDAAIVSRSPRRGTLADPLARAASANPAAGESSAAVQDVLGSPVPAGWIEGFYPIYETAQKTFGVNWLLIASVHAQETAFSTAPGTYHGLNFAHCCGGPMQFNVTDGGAGTASTWDMVADSYRDAPRPAHYDHRTVHHPSIYDDFDSIMAAAHLLQLDGAGYALNDSAWWAAYDYYGHDSYGVTYADQVLARAIGWSQHGFCTGCGVSSVLVAAVQAAYGAPVDAQIQAEEEAVNRAEARRRRTETLKRRRLARQARRRRGR